MSFRTVYGQTISEDGWRMCNEDECTWSVVPGSSNVSIELRSGAPTTILVAFAARFNQAIEPLRDADTGGWTLTNDVSTSNHLAGTAMDLNWDSHPFHAVGTYGDRLPKLRALLDEFKGCVWWGGDWEDPVDEMHFQLNYPEGDQRLIDLANSLGPSAPPPPPPPPLSKADQYALATIQEGQRLAITPRGIQIALSVELVETNLTMYANSNDPASLDLPHDAVGSDHMSSGLFQQQPPWGSLADRMDPARSANIFFTVDNGPGVRGLTKIRDADDNLYDYNDTSNSPGFYAQKVQGSAFPDRYDERFSDAVDLYGRLASLPPPQEEGFLMALTAAQQQQMYEKITSTWDSRSPFRHLGEHSRDDTVGFLLNTDSNTHVPVIITLAMLGDPGSLALLEEVAAADPTKYPDRQDDAQLAKRVLAALSAAPPVVTPPSTPPGTPGTPPIVVPPSTPPPTPSPKKVTLLTISGHMADMWTGYPADLARAMDPRVFYWQPVGAWDFNGLPLGPPCDAGYREGVRLLREVHPSGPWAIACYSQGAIIGSRLYMALAPGGELADRAADFVGGVTWGNPYREQGSYVGHDPGGHGISSTRIVGTGPHWHDYVDPGDLYANVNGPAGDDETAIYDLVMRVNPIMLLGEAMKLFTNPAPELIAMVQAIIQGITFAAGNPMTASHVSYQWREVVPGITYFQHAVNTMKSIGAQVR